MPEDTEIVVVLCTVPSADEGKKIARELVDNAYAACVNIVPSITSIYKWEGKVEEDSEALIIIKTDAGSTSELVTKIKEIHPYDIPEVIALPVSDGNAGYIDWVKECTEVRKKVEGS